MWTPCQPMLGAKRRTPSRASIMPGTATPSPSTRRPPSASAAWERATMEASVRSERVTSRCW